METNPVKIQNLSVMDTESTRTPTQELGKNEFLQILAVQLANQDPLEPTSDTDFIAQMAQFSSLEQMQAMNETTLSTQTYSLIGKYISAQVMDERGVVNAVEGMVTGSIKQNGTDYLIVGEYYVPLSAIKQIYDSGATNQSLLAQSSVYIDKTIEATLPTSQVDKEGKTIYEDVKGVVENIYEKNGIVYAKLKDSDKEVMVAFITKYYNTPEKTETVVDEDDTKNVETPVDGGNTGGEETPPVDGDSTDDTETP